MKNHFPSLKHFDHKALESEIIGSKSGSEACFRVDVIPARMTQRVLVGFYNEETEQGISVAFFPATGEVCDLTCEGGVIGYLSDAPMIPGDPVACELKISRFGKNLVCSVRINGKLFLYPAFVATDQNTNLTAVVGQEADGSNAMIGWANAVLESQVENESVAA